MEAVSEAEVRHGQWRKGMNQCWRGKRFEWLGECVAPLWERRKLVWSMYQPLRTIKEWTYLLTYLTLSLQTTSMSCHKNVFPYTNDKYVSSRLQLLNVASRIGINCYRSERENHLSTNFGLHGADIPWLSIYQSIALKQLLPDLLPLI